MPSISWEVPFAPWQGAYRTGLALEGVKGTSHIHGLVPSVLWDVPFCSPNNAANRDSIHASVPFPRLSILIL